MALLRLNDFIDLNVKGYHDATSWQFATDPEFKDIIDESLHDEVNLTEWVSMLPKKDGGYYADLDQLWARVKLHIDHNESPWYVCPPKNQNDQTIIVTELDGSKSTYNSITDNFN